MNEATPKISDISLMAYKCRNIDRANKDFLDQVDAKIAAANISVPSLQFWWRNGS